MPLIHYLWYRANKYPFFTSLPTLLKYNTDILWGCHDIKLDVNYTYDMRIISNP